jgi:hypothetical protein
MNRNYRVVFNQSTGTYVAVAENTSARKKSKTTVKTISRVTECVCDVNGGKLSSACVFCWR